MRENRNCHFSTLYVAIKTFGVEIMTNYVIRAVQGDDIPFIYSTWLKSYRNDSGIGLSVRKSVFFENYRLILDKILQENTTKVLVACKPDEPNVIFGYLVADPSENVLHYVFVKEAFWRLGIAKSLFKQLFPSSGSVFITHLTRTASSLEILSGYEEIGKFTYNPFLLYRLKDGNV